MRYRSLLQRLRPELADIGHVRFLCPTFGLGNKFSHPGVSQVRRDSDRGHDDGQGQVGSPNDGSTLGAGGLRCSDGTPGRSENCPDVNGPGVDMVNPGILRMLSKGKRVFVAARKDGHFYGLDPYNSGAVLCDGAHDNKPRSGVYWGGAADDKNVYFGLPGGVLALQLATGERVWFNDLGSPAGGQNVWHATTTTRMPGAIFIAGGNLQAVSASDGHQLWEFDTNREFETVNKVPARGGAMQAAGSRLLEECASWDWGLRCNV